MIFWPPISRHRACMTNRNSPTSLTAHGRSQSWCRARASPAAPGMKSSAAIALWRSMTIVATALVGRADYRDPRDVLVAEQEVLDLGRVGIAAADAVHVLDAPGYLQVAAVVHQPHVTGVQPAVRVDGRRGALAVIEVAGHDVIAADHDFAWFAAGLLPAIRPDDCQFSAGNRPAGEVGDGVRIVIGAADRRRTVGLGQAVSGDDRAERHLASQPPDQLDGNVGSPGHRGAQ